MNVCCILYIDHICCTHEHANVYNESRKLRLGVVVVVVVAQTGRARVCRHTKSQHRIFLATTKLENIQYLTAILLTMIRARVK